MSPNIAFPDKLPNAWPECLAVKSTCNVPPLLDGFHTDDQVPVNVGETMRFKCNDESQGGRRTDDGRRNSAFLPREFPQVA